MTSEEGMSGICTYHAEGRYANQNAESSDVYRPLNPSENKKTIAAAWIASKDKPQKQN